MAGADLGAWLNAQPKPINLARPDRKENQKVPLRRVDVLEQRAAVVAPLPPSTRLGNGPLLILSEQFPASEGVGACKWSLLRFVVEQFDQPRQCFDIVVLEKDVGEDGPFTVLDVNCDGTIACAFSEGSNTIVVFPIELSAQRSTVTARTITVGAIKKLKWHTTDRSCFAILGYNTEISFYDLKRTHQHEFVGFVFNDTNLIPVDFEFVNAHALLVLLQDGASYLAPLPTGKTPLSSSLTAVKQIQQATVENGAEALCLCVIRRSPLIIFAVLNSNGGIDFFGVSFESACDATSPKSDGSSDSSSFLALLLDSVKLNVTTDVLISSLTVLYADDDSALLGRFLGNLLGGPVICAHAPYEAHVVECPWISQISNTVNPLDAFQFGDGPPQLVPANAQLLYTAEGRSLNSKRPLILGFSRLLLSDGEPVLMLVISDVISDRSVSATEADWDACVNWKIVRQNCGEILASTSTIEKYMVAMLAYWRRATGAGPGSLSNFSASGDRASSETKELQRVEQVAVDFKKAFESLKTDLPLFTPSLKQKDATLADLLRTLRVGSSRLARIEGVMESMSAIQDVVKRLCKRETADTVVLDINTERIRCRVGKVEKETAKLATQWKRLQPALQEYLIELQTKFLEERVLPALKFAQYFVLQSLNNAVISQRAALVERLTQELAEEQKLIHGPLYDKSATRMVLAPAVESAIAELCNTLSALNEVFVPES